MAHKLRFRVGDVIRTGGGRTPWRIESIGDGTAWHTRGVQAYRCVSLTSGRHEEYRVTNLDLLSYTGTLPKQAPPSRVSGHALMDKGAPHDARGTRTGPYWRSAGEGRAKCECGDLSPVLHSAGQRKQWHREHKATVRAEHKEGAA